MPSIQVLDQNTINQIAAGEVIERPSSVAKELLENAIDAKATAITVEIKDGGISFIRITDNGCGIKSEEIPLAFLRHSTSKIKTVEDLLTVSSLGFRGEALSSIAAVGQVELITKVPEALNGARYVIEGGKEQKIEEIGCPEGTTFLVRNLFFNTPARKKFLKTAQTEASYLSEVVERIALSHPEISVRFINNNQNKLHTSGNGSLKDIIYQIYGREITNNLLSIHAEENFGSIQGYIGKPLISRGNRSFENYYVNNRYIRSQIIAKAIEDAYQPYLMQHKYPFVVFNLTIKAELLDINVHPTKMELRFRNSQEVYEFVKNSITKTLEHKELIPEIEFKKTDYEKPVKSSYHAPEPFETKRMEELKENIGYPAYPELPTAFQAEQIPKPVEEQIKLPIQLLSEEAKPQHKIIGQLFQTYWLVQLQDKLYFIDQHAAHEKVLYEKTIKRLKKKEYISQLLQPPIIVTLDLKQETLLKQNIKSFEEAGFAVEPFGGREYAVSAVPYNLFGLISKDIFLEMLDNLLEEWKDNAHLLLEQIASMSCKAAVKGNSSLSIEEAKSLIDQLLLLDNPYHCPHGRPTIIAMTKTEIERKFKRII